MRATRAAALTLLLAIIACAGPEPPDLAGTWFVRARTDGVFREQTNCLLVPGTCYTDSIARGCEWSVTVSVTRARDGYAGNYRDAWSECSDGFVLPGAGDATASVVGESFQLGPGFPEYWPVAVQLAAPGVAVLLDGAVVPPDSMYGASQFGGYVPVCSGGGWCSRGSFVASQRAMPDGPLGLVRN